MRLRPSRAVACLLGFGGLVDERQGRTRSPLERTLTPGEDEPENSNEDKGGHRVKALQATREAIEQTKKGIAFDNAHQGEKK